MAKDRDGDQVRGDNRPTGRRKAIGRLESSLVRDVMGLWAKIREQEGGREWKRL
jgi:hypothetical protein